MKVKIIAQNAQIRHALAVQFELRKRQFYCVDDQCLQAHEKTLEIPDDVGVVINAVSLENLHNESKQKSLLEQVKLISHTCEKANVVLIHLSSSHIFDEEGNSSSFKENDEAKLDNPTSALLWQLENVITQLCSRHVILRTGLLFSDIKDNMLTSLLSSFERKESLLLSSSSQGCPTHTYDLARVVSAILDQISCHCDDRMWGTYHYHSSDPTSRYKFTEAVLAAVSQVDSELVEGVVLQPVDEPDATWSQPILNCDKILNTFGIKQLPWRSFVLQTVKQILSPEIVDSKVK